jgi:hypothetical protein
MNENENVVVESTENVEAVSTEEIIAEEKPSKTFTQDEVNDIVNKRLARKEARIRKEYERKYGLLKKSNDNSKKWTWVNDPWPWEGE